MPHRGKSESVRKPAPYPASLGCCGASCKDDCVRPPCPCNPDAWSPTERDQLAPRRGKWVEL